MVDTEDMDPQYHWILPTYLEPTQYLLGQIKYEGDKVVSPVTGPAGWPYYIARLVNGFENEKRKDIRVQYFHMNLYCSASEEYFRDKKGQSALGYTHDTYVDMKMTLLALQHIGLDVHGGIDRLMEVKVCCERRMEPFPITSIIVINPVKARKYVNIGINIELNASLQKEPESLEEAAKDYIQISELVESWDPNTSNKQCLDEEIEERIGIGKRSHLDWEFAREKFRLQILKRFKDALVAKVDEEKKNSEPRARKRARCDK